MEKLREVLSGLRSLEKAEYVALPVMGDVEEMNDVPSEDMPPPTARRRRALQTKLLFAIACALFVALVTLAYNLFLAPSCLFAPPFLISAFHNRFAIRSPTRVGPRQYYGLYHGRGCSSRELIAAVGKSRAREDGRSRHEYSQPEGVNELDMSNFEFSFDVEDCPAPHVFSPEEACDLISSFGGIFNRGDSLMRQFTQGLYLVLTSSFDQVGDEHEACSGNKLFTNGRLCKFHSIYDSRKLPGGTCPAAVVLYDQVWNFASVTGEDMSYNEGADRQRLLLDGYQAFLDSRPSPQRNYSPIFVEATGIHYQWRVADTLSYHVLPFLANTSSTVPRPIPFFSGYPAVPANKPPEYLGVQGPEPTKRYNEEMEKALAELGEGNSWRGEWSMLEWYNATDGGWSYDGTHFDAQVAIERAQVFLNVLDAVWGEIVQQGGLAD
ncbi:hypothetical protein JCM11641_001979 [Rhodosporidiobolus odoratus]